MIVCKGLNEKLPDPSTGGYLKNRNIYDRLTIAKIKKTAIDAYRFIISCVSSKIDIDPVLAHF
jgi:hypothetical protein